MNLFSSFKIMSVAMLCGIAITAYAESAPVYDADSLPAQFGNSSDQNQPDAMPPAPGQESSAQPKQQQTWMPVSSPSKTSAAAAPAPVDQAPPTSSSLEKRMKRVEQQMDNLQGVDSSARVDALQNEVQSLRGQLEQVTHQLQQMKDQQKSMYADLDKRLTDGLSKAKQKASSVSVGDDVNAVDTSDNAASDTVKKPTASKKPKAVTSALASTIALKTATDVAKTTVTAPAADASSTTTTADASTNTVSSSNVDNKALANQPDVAEEQQIYQTAYSLIKEKKYDQAVNILQGMLRKYPSGQFASNAHYWLGELYGLMGKNDQALTEFNTVVKTYPSSPRVSDAQLKVGLLLATQSKWRDAKTALKTVINRYPGTASARLASAQLKQIKQAGH